MATLEERVVAALAGVGGVQAIALGGSRSRAEATPDSDTDVGLYYAADRLDTAVLAERLTALDDGRRQGLLNPPGAWGPWVNGGAWLVVEGRPLDVLLRDVGHVRRVLADCLVGRVTIDYQSGHPFGFVNAIYAAEVHYAEPLWQDASAPLDGLKALLYSQGPYPPRMREALMGRFLWEASFSLACGRKAALRGDVHYAMGSTFRAVCAWLEALYALNERYLMNEKGALPNARALRFRPGNMEARVGEAYRLFAAGDAAGAYEVLDALHAEVEGLLAGRMVEGERPG